MITINYLQTARRLIVDGIVNRVCCKCITAISKNSVLASILTTPLVFIILPLVIKNKMQMNMEN